MMMLNLTRLKNLIHRRSVAAMTIAAFVIPATVQAHHPDREHQRVTPTVDLIGPMWTQVEPGHRRKYNRPTYWGGKISYLIAPSSQEAMTWHRAVHAKAYEKPKKCLRLEQHYFYPKPYHALTVGPRRPRTASQSVVEASPTHEHSHHDHHHPHQEMLSSPLTANDLPSPIGDETIELPELSGGSGSQGRETQELSNPSNSVPSPTVDDSSLFVPRGNIRRAIGRSEDLKVSRDVESLEPRQLDVAERPVFLRRVLNR